MLAPCPDSKDETKDNNTDGLEGTTKNIFNKTVDDINNEIEDKETEEEEEDCTETPSTITKPQEQSDIDQSFTDPYLADESSLNVDSISDSEVKSTSDKLSVVDDISDRTSPSKSLSDFEEPSVTDSCNNGAPKFDSVALHRSSNIQKIVDTSSSENTSFEHYEEFSNSEIAEAKKAVEIYPPISSSTPEPHSASPIKEILTTLHKEASKYRNIQVIINPILIICCPKINFISIASHIRISGNM